MSPMHQKKRNKLTMHDKQIIDLFIDLGMPQNLAKTLIYISKVDTCRSRDIEQGADLLQPQVSLAIQELTDKGWIKKHTTQKKKGKGRPVHFYKLSTHLPHILKNVEQEKRKEIDCIKTNLSELEQLLSQA